jgi:hypothetical protein
VVKHIVYIPDTHPVTQRLNRFRKKFIWSVQIREPRFWRGEIEQCDEVVVEDSSSEIAVAYSEAGIKVRVLKPRRVEMKEVVIDFDRQDARDHETNLNMSMSKSAQDAKREHKKKKRKP